MAGIALTVVSAAVAAAQTVVAGNLGAGNTFQLGTVNSWAVGTENDSQFEDAVSFVYGGSSVAQLYSYSWAVNFFSGSPSTLYVDFMHGSDIATATTLVTGSIPDNFANINGSLFTTFPGSSLDLLPGDTYWLRMRLDVPSLSIWGWQWNDQGQSGYSFRYWDISDPNNPSDQGWFTSDGATPAFQVEAVPEPGTLGLLATGLLLMGASVGRGVRRRTA
jgi:hypothetical protein